MLVTVPVFEVYPAEVFSASVHTSKQDSTAPEASIPRGELPKEQLAPLAFRAVARLARPVRLPNIPPEAVNTPVMVEEALIVELAVERKPCKKPKVVEVETPHEVGVHEKVPEPPVGQVVRQTSPVRQSWSVIIL